MSPHTNPEHPMSALALPLDDALAVLSRVATTSNAPADESAMQVRAARALDLLASHGVAVSPERFVIRLAAIDETSARELLDLFLSILDGAPRCASAIAARIHAVAASDAKGLPLESALGHAARRVLLDPACAIGAYLPRATALINEFRREELVRAWAAAIELPIETRGKVEAKGRSEKALERLDYRRIREDEERLAIERRVLTEHAEAVREKQRKAAEAEALASAQRE